MSHEHTHGHCDAHHHCECGSCSCGQSCACGSHHHHPKHEKGSFSCELLELADAAWMDLLKEKIKAEIQASSGKHLDELAKLVSEGNKARWQNKMSLDRQAEEYSAKVREFFHYRKE